MATVTANPTGKSLLYEMHSQGDRISLIQKGAGLSTVIHGSTTGAPILKFTDIFNSSVEIYYLNLQWRPPRDFVNVLPTNAHGTISGPGVIANYEHLYTQLVNETSFDSTASLRVVTMFNTHKGRVASKRPAAPVTTGEADLSPERIATALEDELRVHGIPFASEMEEAVKLAFASHFNWESPEGPILEWGFWFEKMRSAMPLRWASLGGGDDDDPFKFMTIVGLLRNHNKHLLAMFESIPAMAPGAFCSVFLNFTPPSRSNSRPPLVLFSITYGKYQ